MKQATYTVNIAAAVAIAKAQSLRATLAAVPSVNQAIVNYINKQGRCSFMELYSIFGPEEDNEAARKKFSTRMKDLVDRDLITASQAKKTGGIRLQDRIYLPATTAQAERAKAITPPPQINTMTAPVYVPPASTVLRPGALDYQRYASRGVRC